MSQCRDAVRTEADFPTQSISPLLFLFLQTTYACDDFSIALHLSMLLSNPATHRRISANLTITLTPPLASSRREPPDSGGERTTAQKQGRSPRSEGGIRTRPRISASNTSCHGRVLAFLYTSPPKLQLGQP